MTLNKSVLNVLCSVYFNCTKNIYIKKNSQNKFNIIMFNVYKHTKKNIIFGLIHVQHIKLCYNQRYLNITLSFGQKKNKQTNKNMYSKYKILLNN